MAPSELLSAFAHCADDAFFAAIGPEIDWARLRRTVFGIAMPDGSLPTLCEQVAAGLRLYVVTAEMLASALRPEDAPLVHQTAARITQVRGH